jgi:phenylacetate-coenzyme A ligase PaaK-like adenylate-forming protein
VEGRSGGSRRSEVLEHGDRAQAQHARDEGAAAPEAQAGARLAIREHALQPRALREGGVKPKEIRSFEDFAAAITISGQEQIRAVIGEIGLDMDRLMLNLFGEKRLGNLYLLTTTSGTTGIPTPYPNFRASIRDSQEIISRAAWRMGFRPGDRIGLCFGLSMHAAGTPRSSGSRTTPESR